MPTPLRVPCSAAPLLLLAALVALSVCLPAPAWPSQPPRHVFHLDRLRDPLTVTSVVQERDGGSLEVGLADPDGKREGALFSYRGFNDHGPHSAWGRLYVDEWLVPLGSPQQERVARAVRRYAAGHGKLADNLLAAVDFLEQLSKAVGTTSDSGAAPAPQK